MNKEAEAQREIEKHLMEAWRGMTLLMTYSGDYYTAGRLSGLKTRIEEIQKALNEIMTLGVPKS